MTDDIDSLWAEDTDDTEFFGEDSFHTVSTEEELARIQAEKDMADSLRAERRASRFTNVNLPSRGAEDTSKWDKYKM